ncbi:MAG: M48 family metallopeptidase [Candidatus Bathyarchaeia archaeon]
MDTVQDALSVMPFGTGFVNNMQNSLRQRILRDAIPGDEYPPLLSVALQCAKTLALDFLPRIYLSKSSALNAFSFGTDKQPVIALNIGLLRVLRDKRELAAIVGHEMGHIKSQHITYHSLAEMLAAGASFATGFFATGILISASLQMLLLSWARKSELTADRASLIVTGNLRSVVNTVARIAGGTNVSEKELEKKAVKADEGFLEKLFNLGSRHPSALARIKAIEEFHKSEQYLKIRMAARRREAFEGEVLSCAYCEAPMLDSVVFCSSCHKSQL